jgi:Rod binding domain-containing protein
MKLFYAFLTFVFIGTTANAIPLNDRNNKSFSIKSKMTTTDLDTQDKKILKQAKDLESVLVSKMVEPMFPEGKDGMLYGGGAGNSVYRGMMIEQYGKILTQKNGLGLAENIAKRLTIERRKEHVNASS